MGTAEDSPTAAALIVERTAVAEHLLDEQTRFEPFVLLEAGPDGARVRKLTMPEKIVHSDRTGASVFMADEHEQEEFFGLLDRQVDAE